MNNPNKIFGRLGNNLFQFAYIYGQFKRGAIKDIYVQDPIYFEQYREELKGLLVGIPEKIDKVAIHVRRTDYVGNSFYVDLMETDYYKKAMEEFKGYSFIVFSDDIEWCKKQDIFKDCEFYHGTELEDIGMMTQCTGHIIANSSFSWWGAYLSDSQKVIAPKAWYSDRKERTKCPNSWIRI